LLATTGQAPGVHLWQVSTRTRQATLPHASWVESCAFSPDGALLATTGDDGAVRLWRVADGNECAVLTGHTGWVQACTFSRDGNLLVTSGNDGTIRLWRLPGGQPHCALRVAGPLAGIAWHPDGSTLCAVGGAGVYLLSYRP
jgi:WD40 repeat protein